jgi:hypothetical protein
MSRIINPILLDRTAGAPTPRNFARQVPIDSNTPTFAQQLASVKAPSAPTPLKRSSMVQPASFSRTESQTPATAQTNTTESNVDSANQTTESNSSWRVNRSAANVDEEVDDFSFDDVIDMINPLHHIPIIGTIYREMTGDQIKPVSRIVGDIAYGALSGSLLISGIASVVSAAYEQQTGEEPTVQIADALFDLKKSKIPDTTPPTMLAQADTASASQAPAPSAAPAPAPVQVASLDAAQAAAATQPTTSAQTPNVVSKQPYGGVMDMTGAAKNQQRVTNVNAPASMQGVRVGDTVYTNIEKNKLERKLALQAAIASAQKKEAQTEPAQTASASNASTFVATPLAAQSTAPKAETSDLAALAAPSSIMTVPGTTPADDQKLGKLLHQSAGLSTTGHALPPDLVHDMMLMALDKYKTAGNLAPSEMTIGLP